MKSIKSWQWGGALVLLAMLALIYLGWQGLKGQRALIWQDARTDCTRWSSLVAQQLPRTLQSGKRTIQRYDYPPVPGKIEFDPDAGLAAMQQWQDTGGTTTTGLPVRVLASLILFQDKPSTASAYQLADLARLNEPSVITPKVFEFLDQMNHDHSLNLDSEAWRQKWDKDEKARELISSHDVYGWHNQDGELWWLWPAQGQSLDYVSSRTLHRMLEDLVKSQLRLPEWVGIQLRFRDAVVGHSGHVLGETHSGQLQITVGVVEPDLLEYHWKKTRQWNLMMMGLASFALISGLSMVAAGAIREKRRSAQQNNFIASVTHELRAPVGSMRLMAEALESGKVNGDKVSEFHHLMAKEGGRLTALIENVLDLARIESGEDRHHPRTVDLLDLMSGVCESLRMQAREKGIEVKLCDIAQDVSIDPVHFRQAVLNLIDNAIKFSPEDGKVTVDWGVSRENGRPGWWIAVADSGPGIASGDEKRIFDRFYRSGDEMRRESQGAGVGLHLVKHIVSDHDGHICVSSGPGARFTLTFPSE